MFSRAIARTPGRSLVHGLTTAGLGTPEFGVALVQHHAYVAALQKCGIDVTLLPPEEEYPDSVFIEDTALCTSRCTVVARPGAPTRRGEEISVARVLRGLFECIESIVEPGTLDAGDVLMVEEHFFVGLSSRTNREGARQLLDLLRKHGYSGAVLPIGCGLHLKTGISYLGERQLLATAIYRDLPEFSGYGIIDVPEAEAYAANSIRINDAVVMPAGYPVTRDRIVDRMGCRVIEVDTSEFRKLDGGVSCLSLRF
jgi:dimethylargininase